MTDSLFLLFLFLAEFDQVKVVFISLLNLWTTTNFSAISNRLIVFLVRGQCSEVVLSRILGAELSG